MTVNGYGEERHGRLLRCLSDRSAGILIVLLFAAMTGEFIMDDRYNANNAGLPQAIRQETGAEGTKYLKGLGVIIGIALLLFGISLAVVFPKQAEFVVELGENASVSPTDYLFGYPFIVNHAEIDVSGVNTGRAGEYKADARLLMYRYTIDVRVEDTTPPSIIPFETELYIATGREYSPQDFAESVSDASGHVGCVIRYGGSEYDSIAFPLAGSFTLLLEAKDGSGNTGSREIRFTVDDPPVIVGAFDRHLPVGTDFNIKAIAADSGDGILSDSMRIDAGGFDPDTEGEYTVTYTVADSHGLQSEKSVTLTVCGKKDTSLWQDDLSLTDSEMKLLCDVGYFTYKPLDAPDYDKVISLIEPALVDLKQKRGPYAYTAGSGCIYRITPEYIYMLSVNHVMNDVNRNCDIMFFDGKAVRKNLNYVSSKNHNELALFRIPVSDVPTDTLLTLRQIYVDRGIYSRLSEGDEVIAYAKHWAGTDQDVIRRMKVKKLTSSIREFGLLDSLLETTEGVVGGMSGTAVVDLKGNLVGLASAYGTATDNEKNISAFHSRIDVLDEVEAALEAADKAA